MVILQITSIDVEIRDSYLFIVVKQTEPSVNEPIVLCNSQNGKARLMENSGKILSMGKLETSIVRRLMPLRVRRAKNNIGDCPELLC